MAYWQYIHVKALYKRILKDGWSVNECVRDGEEVRIVLKPPDLKEGILSLSILLTPTEDKE